MALRHPAFDLTSECLSVMNTLLDGAFPAARELLEVDFLGPYGEALQQSSRVRRVPSPMRPYD